MTQRYHDPEQRSWMAEGRCPECNYEPARHSDQRYWGRNKCSLREDGVIDRIRQYQQDLEEANASH
jgi:hypothetical protein